MISAAVKNESEANNLLPLIMIPQIILSGVLFDLSGLPSKLAWLMISRWSIGAYGVLVNVNEMVPQTQAGAASAIDQFVKTNPVYETTWHNLTLSWEILVLHTVIYLAIALWLQKRKDII